MCCLCSGGICTFVGVYVSLSTVCELFCSEVFEIFAILSKIWSYIHMYKHAPSRRHFKLNVLVSLKLCNLSWHMWDWNKVKLTRDVLKELQLGQLYGWNSINCDGSRTRTRNAFIDKIGMNILGNAAQ